MEQVPGNKSAEEQRRSKAEIDALISASFGGIIIVDERGRIKYISDMAKYILDCAQKNVTDKYVLNVFNALDEAVLDGVLKNREHVFMHMTSSNNNKFVVNIEPMMEGEAFYGAVISVRKWNDTLKSETENVGAEGNRAKGRFSQYVCCTEVFRTLVKKAKLAAYTDAPVLLCGEEGTETNGFANCIHNESSRHKMNFVEVECSAWDSDKISRVLFESPDNGINSKCVLEMLEGGTLYLNHIDRLSLELQFRICQLIKGQYTLNSDIQKRAANVRVLASTDKNLREYVSKGKFRSDLYYALNVITLEFPPLRERKEDIRCIVELFVAHYAKKYLKPVYITENAYDCICEYSWPGNTRQLEYFCQKLLLTAPGRNINEVMVRKMLNEMRQNSVPDKTQQTVDNAIEGDEEAAILKALEKNNGNKTKTAASLGISRATLWRKIQKYGLND